MKIETKRVSPVTGAILLLVVFIVISLWLMFEYLEDVRARDMSGWQSRLALLAEIRTTAVEDYLAKKKHEVEEIAQNTTIQLFMSQSTGGDVDSPIIRAQQGHVRNLLSASASRLGIRYDRYTPDNIEQKNNFGLAIVNTKRALVMATRGFPQINGDLDNELSRVEENRKARIIEIHKGENNKPVFGYIAPVLHIQAAQKNNPVGYVVVLIDPEPELYKLLENRQSMTNTDESLLVRLDGTGLVYMSPLAEGFKLFHLMPDDANSLAASYAYHSHGGIKIVKDYKGDRVLVTGRSINGTDWGLIQKINAEEALAESDQHQAFLLTIFSVIVLFVAAAFIAIWRHSTSMRLQEMSNDLETHIALLDAVTDNIQDHIILVDEERKIKFMNPVFMAALNVQDEDIMSLNMKNLLGVRTQEILEQVPEDGLPVARCIEINGSEKNYHVSVNRLSSGSYKDARLYVLHDISELRNAQLKREQLAKGIITTLVKAVDRHDPYCANHSERTREVAVEIAEELQLGDERCEALEMAALLANIGKLFVSKEILTKMEPLSEEESKELRRHIEYAVEILSELSFNGPVIDIISQKNERMDGSGYPGGLTGDKILLESSILAVANSFVAMASSRAYREGMPVREAVDLLLKQADTLYDRHVVAALFHISENRHDWSNWQKIES